jgi:DNA-binding transcriptional regulator GbsR (MarR family)
MNVIKLVASSSFLTVNVAIAHEIGLDSAVVLGELASTQVYWEERGEVDENGMFYETAEQIEQKTTLSPYKQAKAIRELEARGLVKTKMKGVPAKKYFFVDGEELGRLLESKFPKNLKASIQKTLKQDSKKLEGNNKRVNKKREVIKENNTVLNSMLSEPVKEKLIDFLEYRKEIKKPYKSERSVPC